MEDIEVEIKKVINKLKPYLNRDGGDIDFVKFEDGIVYVHMLGACAGVEMILVEEVPGVLEVRAV